MKKTSLLVLFLTVFIDLIGFGMVIPFLPFYAREYGASGFRVGAIVGVYSIMQFFFAPVWGRLSDRIGRRPVILISLTASCLGYGLFAFARSIAMIFLSRLIAGIGGASIGTAQAYIADITTPENRAKGMGMIGAAFGMGFILGPPLSGILSSVGQHHGMTGNLLPGLAATTMSFSALMLALAVLGESKKPGTGSTRPAIPPQFDRRVWNIVLHRSAVGLIILCLFLTMLAVSGMETSVTLHARDRFQFRQLDMAYFFLFMGAIVAVLQGGLIGRLAKRFGEPLLIVTGTVSFSFALFAVPSIWRVPLLYGVAFFIAVGQGLTYPSLTALITKVTPSEEHGSMLGIAAGLGSLARFLGPILSGSLYDLAQSRGAFYGGAIMATLAFLAALRLRRVVPAHGNDVAATATT